MGRGGGGGERTGPLGGGGCGLRAAHDISFPFPTSCLAGKRAGRAFLETLTEPANQRMVWGVGWTEDPGGLPAPCWLHLSLIPQRAHQLSGSGRLRKSSPRPPQTLGRWRRSGLSYLSSSQVFAPRCPWHLTSESMGGCQRLISFLRIPSPGRTDSFNACKETAVDWPVADVAFTKRRGGLLV